VRKKRSAAKGLKVILRKAVKSLRLPSAHHLERLGIGGTGNASLGDEAPAEPEITSPLSPWPLVSGAQSATGQGCHSCGQRLQHVGKYPKKPPCGGQEHVVARGGHGEAVRPTGRSWLFQKKKIFWQ
jgi:hypothetical protein